MQGDWVVLSVLSVLGGRVVSAAVNGVLRHARDRAVNRRHRSVPVPATTAVPARLRGGAPTYPLSFHAGVLDVATACWRPRWRWGAAPVMLGRSRIYFDRRAFHGDGVADAYLAATRILTCEDAGGARFEFAIHEDDLIAVWNSLAIAPHRLLTRSPAERIRYRIPAGALVSALTGVGWAALIGLVVPGGWVPALVGGAVCWLWGAGAVVHTAWLAYRFDQVNTPPRHIAHLDP